MHEDPPFQFPDITDKEIHRATRLLGLPEDAFYGKDGKDRRQYVLKCKKPIDIASCPGSGKTTLLVAKLAILAPNWPHRTRGICVLSHTNVARHEIETRLGNTVAGRRLLSYPHYIGTIHHFINQFLAVPWLRSRGYPITMIDSDVCEKRRWNKLDTKSRYALEKKNISKSDVRILDTSFNVGKKKGLFPFKVQTPTYQALQKACKHTAMEGFHCYDDMFIWAHDMMDTLSYIVEVIRDRFPLLFIDEAQDNSEDQSQILFRIFNKGQTTVIRQRLGDSNQAIFDFVEAKEATTDLFPDETIKTDIPNSHRFGQHIARLADPLGLTRYRCSLIGQGPKNPLASGVTDVQHTIFLFKDDEAERVLDSYAQLLLDTFSQEELHKGTFTAVGQVHKDTGDVYKPRHVGHYWPNYDSRIIGQDPKPDTLIQYIWAGAAKADIIGESFPLVEKTAQGVLRLAGMSQHVSINFNRRHCHRYVRELLENKTDALSCYAIMVSRFGARRKLPTKETWTKRWSGAVRQIAETISGTILSVSEVDEFLRWKEPPNETTFESPLQNTCTNMYCFTKDGKQVQIRVGSIHSVKGQTHTATLVLETFWQGRNDRHNLELLLPWLNGANSGCAGEGPHQQTRLKIHYVAMSRPSHLLCLAMNRHIFENEHGDLDEDKLAQLQNMGWQIKCVGQ
jgi:hypothetical protein